MTSHTCPEVKSEPVPMSDDSHVYSGKEEQREDDDGEVDIGAAGICIYDGTDEYKIEIGRHDEDTDEESKEVSEHQMPAEDGEEGGSTGEQWQFPIPSSPSKEQSASVDDVERVLFPSQIDVKSHKGAKASRTRRKRKASGVMPIQLRGKKTLHRSLQSSANDRHLGGSASASGQSNLDYQPERLRRFAHVEAEAKGRRLLRPEVDRDGEASRIQCLGVSRTKRRKRSGHKSLTGKNMTRSAVEVNSEGQQILHQGPSTRDGTDQINDAEGSKVPDTRIQIAVVATRLYQCGVCEKSFEMPAHLKKHMRQCNHTKCPRCARCLKVFKECEELMEHIKTYHPERPHSCRLCPATFTSAPHLKRHQAIHSGKKPYKCEICAAAFLQSANFKVHLRIHTGEKPYQCDECAAAFTLSSNLKRHKRVHTGEKPYRCELCQTAFAVSSQLKVHMRWHSGEKPFKCDLCSAAFSQSAHLKNHINAHKGEKRYICEHCPAAFVEASNLKVHARIHSGEKPYLCEHCPASFRQSSSLRRHVMIHTGENLHHCTYCPSAFRQKGHLNSHLLIHTGEKPWLKKKTLVANVGEGESKNVVKPVNACKEDQSATNAVSEAQHG